MPVPALVKTWTISPNNRINFVSLNDTMARYLFGVKAFLKAHGYTVVGSSDGTSAGMDAVDRWVSFSNVTTRGANAASAQSWIVLRDGAGVDILLAFQGASDDIARISYSQGQLFLAAGTPTQQPTATDEEVVSSAASLINNTTSGDRVWFGWVDSTSKLCRFAVARQNNWVGRVWGIEEFTSSLIAPATLSPVVWGFAMDAAVLQMPPNGTTVGVARPSVSGTPFNCPVRIGTEFQANNPILMSTVKCELQGGYGFLIQPLTIWSTTTGARGKLGTLIDTYTGRTNVDPGGAYGNLQYIAVGPYTAANTSGLWPWDGVTTPILY